MAFGDVNPPGPCLGGVAVYEIDREHRGGEGDWGFSRTRLHKLMLKLSWWVNRKGRRGQKYFQAGFSGLDNYRHI